MSRGKYLTVTVGLLISTAVAAAVAPPSPVSPGSVEDVEPLAERCPTFTWEAAVGADWLELVVYELAEDAARGMPPRARIAQRLPARATAWTPSLGRCLEPGGRYAWTIRAVSSEAAGEWPVPSLFRVERGPSREEIAAAVEVVRRYIELEAEGVEPGGAAGTGEPSRAASLSLASTADEGDPSAEAAGLFDPAEFQVAGTAEADVLRLGDTGGNEIFWEMREEANNDMTISYLNEFVRIDLTGNVGIGTVIPGAKLDVNGGILSSGPITSGGSITVDGTADTITATGGTIGFGDEDLSTTGSVTLGGFQLAPGAASGRVLTSDVSGNGTWQDPVATPDADWAVSGMHMSSAVSGNVGIGTTGVPDEKLQVAGTAQVDLLRLEDTGGNGIHWDLQENGVNALTFDYAGEKIRFTSTGRVGIGQTNPGQELDVNGQVRLVLDAGAATTVCIDAQNDLSSCSSSRRYKEAIQDLEAGGEVVERLRPVEFRWKQDRRRDLGFVAEEVARIDPLLVTYNADGEIEGVKYRQLTAVLVNALHEQSRRIERLESRLCGDVAGEGCGER